jgi:hypothetical protein
MATCQTCGNDYDKAFELTMNGKRHTFDCFECAIQALAPQCAHCIARHAYSDTDWSAAGNTSVAHIAPRPRALEG